MPNTLGHFGLQSAASRGLFRHVDVRWILLGCVLPDVPWIIRRIVVPVLDPYASRLYFFAQASLLVSLCLCAAIAALARRPRLVLGVLAFNVALHLLLDACQTKLGNGVLLLAPYSWNETNFGLFWPEQWPSHALTGLGVLAVAYFWRKELWQPLRLERRRWPLAATLLVVWIIIPFTMTASAYRADLQNIRTLRESSIGEDVAFDRGVFAGRFRPWTRKSYELQPTPKQDSLISIEGTLVAPDRIEVSRIHVHAGRSRDYFSLAGLALLAASWGVGLWRGRRQPSEC